MKFNIACVRETTLSRQNPGVVELVDADLQSVYGGLVSDLLSGLPGLSSLSGGNIDGLLSSLGLGNMGNSITLSTQLPGGALAPLLGANPGSGTTSVQNASSGTSTAPDQHANSGSAPAADSGGSGQ